MGPEFKNFLKLKGKTKYVSPFTVCMSFVFIFVLILAVLDYGQDIGSILNTQTETISFGVSEEALRKKFKFVEDTHVNSSNIH